MAVSTINFEKTILYSKKNCVQKSRAKCAQYVKNAFAEGGCKYISGDGWNNQSFCKENGFQCIGDFVPIDKNPRATKKRSIQFPPGYVQQVGDICLIKHGKYGHICYATGTGINDWVSDYFQRSPGQADGTGPYCYTGGYERVQFWRHSSVMESTPTISPQVDELEPEYHSVTIQTKAEALNTNTIAVKNIQSLDDLNASTKGTILGTHLRQR